MASRSSKNPVPKQLPPFQKGQSGNPSGRPKLTPEDKALIRKTSSKAIERMAQIVNDDSAFGSAGWLRPQDQISILNTNIDRLMGKPESMTVSHKHEHGGSVGLNVGSRLKDISARLPERIAQAKVIEARGGPIEDAEIVDDPVDAEAADSAKSVG